jgi:hypothetical protein
MSVNHQVHYLPQGGGGGFPQGGGVVGFDGRVGGPTQTSGTTFSTLGETRLTEGLLRTTITSGTCGWLSLRCASLDIFFYDFSRYFSARGKRGSSGGQDKRGNWEFWVGRCLSVYQLSNPILLGGFRAIVFIVISHRPQTCLPSGATLKITFNYGNLSIVFCSCWDYRGATL